MTITLSRLIGIRVAPLRRVSPLVIFLLALAAVGRGAGTCDLSSDGQVNVVDVQIGLNQSLGLVSCTSADINLDSQCNVIDVQLLINTALGAACPAPPTNSPAPGSPGPWVTNFTPRRIHYVSTNGSGNGSIGSPESFETARTHYLCGDQHVYRGGTYNRSGEAIFSRDCTSGEPAVFKGYVDAATGQPENVLWKFGVAQPGRWNWFVNLHVNTMGVTVTGEPGGFQIRKAGGRVINSISHDVQSVPIASFRNPGASDPGIVMYGNITYRAGPGTNGAHNYYVQNDYSAQGYKYFVQNISLESQGNGGRRVFQANDSHGDRGVSGLWLEKNFFGDANPVTNPSSNDGQTLTWDMSGVSDWKPAYKVVMRDNYFVDFFHSSSLKASVRGANGVSMQAEITGNYFARANVSPEGYWGHVGTRDPWVFKDNEIYDPPGGVHIATFRTRKQSGSASGSDGSFKIPNADVWDNNTYGGTFKAELYCGGADYGGRTLAQWRAGTNDCRVTPGNKGFDLNSSTVPNPTSNKVAVLLNEYQCSTCVFKDQQRGNIYVVNWTGASSQTVNISPVVGPNKQYVVRYPRDFFGTPAASGICPASGACNVSLPTRRTSSEPSGRFANAYVITGQP